jgi:hypothetical protein
MFTQQERACLVWMGATGGMAVPWAPRHADYPDVVLAAIDAEIDDLLARGDLDAAEAVLAELEGLTLLRAGVASQALRS